MNKKHGLSGTPVYQLWTAIKQKCYSAAIPHYKFFGGNGAKMCDEWLDPAVFCEWCIDNGWKKGNKIFLKDRTKNFSPENCYVTTVDYRRKKKTIN